jgi:hypothetical protein
MVASKLRVTYAQEFTGGLNLGPPQELAQNEVAVARDVVFSARGGVQQRPGFVGFTGTQLDGTASTVKIMTNTHFRKNDSLYQVFGIKTSDGSMWWSNGDKWFPCPTDNATDAASVQSGDIIGFFTDGTPVGPNGVQFNDKSYFVRMGSQTTWEWNGYVGRFLGVLYSDNIAAPIATANFPRCEVVAAKGQFVFAGSCMEPSENIYHRNRIRWCHPGNPTQWRTSDFIDLDAGVIKAMIPFRDYLAIFTDDAIYGLYGEDTDSFALQPITTDSGTPFHFCVTASPSTLYWWDWDQGVMAMDSGAPYNIFGKIKPFLDRRGFAQPQTIYQAPPNLIWGEGKLYCHFSFLNQYAYPSAKLGNLFVYDPRVSKAGAWTTYSGTSITLARGSCVFPRLYQSDQVIFGGRPCEVIVNDQSQVLDRNYVYDGTDYLVPNALIRTAPFEGPTNATKKRWRRPRVTIRSGSSNQVIQFGYLRNYDEGEISPTNEIALNFNTLAGTLSAVWEGTPYFSDDFPANNTTFWTGFTANVLAVGGVLSITTGTATGTRALTSVGTTFNMTNSAVQIKTVAQPANASQQFLVFNGNEFFRFNIRVAANQLDLDWRNAAAVISTTTVTFNNVSMAWLRIREQDGVVYWETSPDAVTWTIQRQLADPISAASIASMTFQISQGQSTSGTPVGTWDNFSYFPMSNDTKWDENDRWTFDPDVTTSDMPDNFMFFETLPSGGAANALQLEIKSKTGTLSSAFTNDSWGLDSLVLPFREKGVR